MKKNFIISTLIGLKESFLRQGVDKNKFLYNSVEKSIARLISNEYDIDAPNSLLEELIHVYLSVSYDMVLKCFDKASRLIRHLPEEIKDKYKHSLLSCPNVIYSMMEDIVYFNIKNTLKR